MHQVADCAFMEVGSEDIFGWGIATPNQQITFGVSEPERYFHIPFPFIKNPNGYMNKTVISKDLCVS